MFNPKNTVVLFAPNDRSELNNKFGGGGGLEYWPPDEDGSKEFGRPAGTAGKHVLEIFDKDLQNDPAKLKDAVYGDLLHGMENDPTFSNLRSQFVSNYPPAVERFNEGLQKRTGNTKKSIDDMYIRGRLAKNQGDEWNSLNRYSKKQLEILDKMREYIRTGQ